MGSVRAYQLNASAVTAAKQMIQESIDISEVVVVPEAEYEQRKFSWNRQFVSAGRVVARTWAADPEGRTSAMC